MDTNILLTELDADEKAWWKATIITFRQKYITEPRLYADSILRNSWNTDSEMLQNLDSVIKSVREEIWQLYLIDEAKFHVAVLEYLFTERELPATILSQIMNYDFISSIEDKDEFTKEIGRLMGEYAGRVMPYIYELSLSTTQSRRSRAGKTFEQLVESLLDHFDIKFNTQSSVGAKSFMDTGLGKKVDAVVPGFDEYQSNRSKCAIVTMKTTLRERWQEVAEELSRTNVPHIYLLTVDEDVTENVINTIKQYNIALVVFGTEKESKFKSHTNVLSFEDFFAKEMKYIMGYWGAQ